MDKKSLEAFKDDRMQHDKVVKFFPHILELFSDDEYGKYIFLTNVETGCSYLSEEAVDYFGLPGSIMENAGELWGELIAPQDRDAYFKEFKDAVDGRITEFDLYFRAKNREGRYVTCSGRGEVIRDESKNPVFFAGTLINHEMSNNVDPVTGLYSRPQLMSTMHNYMINEKPFYLVMVGVRNFFDINSAYGYRFGNSVLKSMSDYALTFTSLGTLFRVEGTKFVYLVDKEIRKLSDLENNFNSIRSHFENNLVVDGNHLTVDICAAVMTVNEFSVDPNSVYNSALFVLQKAKAENAQNLVIVDEDYIEGNERHLKLLSEIRNCIAEDCRGFLLHYQPIVDAHTENITGMEALVRWQMKSGKVVPPGEFIPWLEQDPIYYELGNWIIHKAIRDTKPLLEIQPDFTININLAYPQLQRPEFKEMMMQILKEEDFPVENIKLELTERCKLLDPEALRNVMIHFKTYGMQTALDDFGTGYSALNLLMEIPVDQIKIDKSFVDNIETDMPKQSLLRAITSCSIELGKKVCVEGIESEEMAEFIRIHFPVTNFQGFYFAKPMPIEEFMEFYYERSR